MSGDARYTSWGRLAAYPEAVLRPDGRSGLAVPQRPYLAYGNGRSYGDSGFPDKGVLVDMRGMNRVIGFDPTTGILVAEAGVLLADVLVTAMPHGWFLPVTPGTRYITLGGAIANDVHGKNHHRAGSFGAHVRTFGLLRSDGSHRRCSLTENAGFFAATVGGMGLTGIIDTVELQLVRVASPDVRQETLRLQSLADFFTHADESDARFEYVVAWIDSLASGRSLGRGALLRANHAAGNTPALPEKKPVPFPLDPPFALINGVSLRAFNFLYRTMALRPPPVKHVPWASFFYPLDRVAGWNRAYGPRGLRQFQCVLPRGEAEAAIRAMLEASQSARHGSFLTVLKSFGIMPPTGILSFARPGMTLTLDFPYRGPKTDRLLAELDAITLAAGGAVNPYKDARMGADVFKASFPGWQRMLPLVDPMARSVFSRRVGLTAAD
jgi:FAD/FMN-containing dehydrogenase